MEATPHEFPWAVYVYNDLGNICGGSLISDRHVLTAAHCTYKETLIKKSKKRQKKYIELRPEQFKLIFSVHEKPKTLDEYPSRSAKTIHRLPIYTSVKNRNGLLGDIAVIELESSIEVKFSLTNYFSLLIFISV